MIKLNKDLFEYKNLTKDEMMDLLKEYNETGSKEIRDNIILHNTKLVSKIVNKFVLNEQDREDFIQIGMIGLLKAVDTYDILGDTNWSTYLATCVANEIRMVLRTANCVKRAKYEECSMNTPIETKKGDDSVVIEDCLFDEKINVQESAENNLLNKEIRESMKEVLTNAEQKVINLRYGENFPTQQEVATLLGVDRSHVTRLEQKALKKLSNVYANKRQLFILTGLPNSGKTLYCKQLEIEFDSIFIISANKLRKQGVKEENLFQTMISEASELLIQCKNVIIDMCNMNKHNRKSLIDKLGCLASKIIGVFIYKNFDDCIVNYNKDYEYIYKKLRFFNLPDINEGFDEIRYVDNSNNEITYNIDNKFTNIDFIEFNRLLKKVGLKNNIGFHMSDEHIDKDGNYYLNNHLYKSLKEGAKLTKNKNTLMAIALHDCGKPLCFNDLRGNSKVSAYLSMEVLLRLGYKLEDISEIVFLIQNHDYKNLDKIKANKFKKDKLEIMREVESEILGRKVVQNEQNEIDFDMDFNTYHEEDEFKDLLKELREEWRANKF